MALGALFLLYRDIIHSLGKWFWHGAAATHTEIARKSRYLEKCTGPLVKEPQQGLTRRYAYGLLPRELEASSAESCAHTHHKTE